MFRDNQLLCYCIQYFFGSRNKNASLKIRNDFTVVQSIDNVGLNRCKSPQSDRSKYSSKLSVSSDRICNHKIMVSVRRFRGSQPRLLILLIWSLSNEFL